MDRSRKLIETIKERNIRPAPRWRVRLRNTLPAAAFLLASLLGALAFSVVLFTVQQADFNVVRHLSHSGLELFLGLLPFFWIALLTGALLTSMYGIRYSQRGYKFTLARQMGYSAALSILLGTLFFISGGAQRLEEAFATQVTLYEGIQERKAALWMMPEQGRLAGRIVDVDSASLRLTDRKGASWTVEFTDDTFVAPIILLEPGEEIKLVGEQLAPGRFRADEIRPWQGPGMGRRRQGGVH